MKCMITKAVFSAIAVLAIAGAAYAVVPEVSNVEMTQRDGMRIVDITYDLTGGPAIVTLSIETNGVAIPDRAVKRLSGDVCRLVDPGEEKHIVWNAGADWPENLTESAQAKVIAWFTNAPPQVMVIDLSKGTAATEIDPYPVYYYTSLDALPGGGLSNVLYKTDMLVMNKIPSGLFAMGDERNAGVSIAVVLTKDFYASVYQVTQKQWNKVMGTDPSNFQNPSHPVEGITYQEIREGPGNTAMDPNWPESDAVYPDSFMGRLRAKTGLGGFDLPTEAQWEYACRAETTTYYNDGIAGSSDDQLDELGWWSGNSEDSTHPVGQKAPNAWGLYDMHGNVYERCLDWQGAYLTGGEDPRGAESSSNRSVRGGAWNSGAASCRVAYREVSYPPNRRNSTTGFRLVRTLP